MCSKIGSSFLLSNYGQNNIGPSNHISGYEISMSGMKSLEFFSCGIMDQKVISEKLMRLSGPIILCEIMNPKGL